MGPNNIHTDNINTNESKTSHKTKQKTVTKQKIKVADSDFKILKMHEYAQINHYQYNILL